jgi:hypothetical protein
MLINVFLTSALVGGEWSASRLMERYPLDRRPIGPQGWYGRYGKEKTLDPTASETPTLSLSSP